MKFKIDYDMLEKIKHSKKGISAAGLFLESSKKSKYNLLINLSNIGFFIDGIIEKDKILIGLGIWWLVANYTIFSFGSKLIKEKIKEESYMDLQKLANSLYKLEVNTTAELLQDSEMLESHLKFKYIDSKPVIIENTYIKVPLSNGYEETLLQEHRFGSKDYEISVEEPVKKKKFKLAKVNS